MKKLIRHNTHYTTKFTGFDTAHLHGHAVDIHDYSHTFWKTRKGHQQTITNLEEIDRRIAKQHPELRFSLARKYKGLVHLADGIGHASDGTIPAGVVTGEKYRRHH